MKNNFSINNVTKTEFETTIQNIPETVWEYRYSVWGNTANLEKSLFSDFTYKKDRTLYIFKRP